MCLSLINVLIFAAIIIIIAGHNFKKTFAKVEFFCFENFNLGFFLFNKNYIALLFIIM